MVFCGGSDLKSDSFTIVSFGFHMFFQNFSFDCGDILAKLSAKIKLKKHTIHFDNGYGLCYN